MIVPIIAGVAAIYGWYRYDKAKQEQQLVSLAAPGFAAPPAPTKFAPISQTKAQSLASAVLGVKAAQASSPIAIPSDRIPSSQYGVVSAAPAPSGTVLVPSSLGASGSISVKL